jgi:DNA processing protein
MLLFRPCFDEVEILPDELDVEHKWHNTTMDEARALAKDEFPALLAETPEPPQTLYIRGVLPSADYKLLTVVGSRRMSPYGRDVTEFLIRGLAGYPVSIVSGLALGIDAAAHRAALDAGLHTIALPGSGVNPEVVYPASNRKLADEIVEKGGAVMSEYAPNEKTRLHYFPERNRIMAGMSHATLIIEAGMKSGTLITARLASDYGRELLIVPHSIFDEGGEGGHLFMRIGAAPVRHASDILQALGLEEQAKTAFDLTPEEERVIEALASPCARDDLIRTLALPVSDANVLLLGMELKGLIKETLGEIRRNF